MNKIGILIEIRKDEIKEANWGVITTARGTNRELYAIVLNNCGEAYKEKLQAYGIHKIINISLSREDLLNVELCAHAVVNTVRHLGITSILGLAGSWGRELLSRIAATLKAPLAMNCIHLDLDQHLAETSMYYGKTTAVIKLSGKCYLYGIVPNTFEAIPEKSEAEVLSFNFQKIEPLNMELVEILAEQTVEVDLNEAEIIISGGRGIGKLENFEILYHCAEELHAAVGASRAAVDAGWAPYSIQIGQTGVKVNPKIYIACGISGSVQHLAGIKGTKIIVAINKDPNAAITSNCNYYIIADLFEIIPELTRQIQKSNLHKD